MNTFSWLHRVVGKRTIIVVFVLLTAFNFIGAVSPSKFFINLNFVALVTAVLLPGFLLAKLSLPKLSGLWPMLVVSLSLGITLLMVVGLAINTLLPFFGVVRPLDHSPVAVAVTGLQLMLLAAVALKKSITLSLPKIDMTTLRKSLALALLPLIACFGAFSINNGGTNLISIALIIIIAMLGFLCVSKPKFRSPLVVFFMAFSVLLLWSMRGSHLAGSDIGTEYYVFNLTHSAGYWDINSYQDAYNACLSITVLPTILSSLTHISGETIYKFWYPLLFSFIAPIIFIYFKRLKNSSMAYIATFFFITQSVFIYWMPMLARQEIALLLFATILFINYGATELGHKPKTALIAFLFLGLVLSHYSTAYMALFTFGMATLIQKVINHFAWGERLFGKAPRKPFPGIRMLMIMFLTTFLWQIQVTSTGNGIISVLTTTASSIFDTNTSNVKNTSSGKVLSFSPYSGYSNDTFDLFTDFKNDAVNNTSRQKSSIYYPNANKYADDIQAVSGREITETKLGPALHLMSAGVSVLVRLALVVGLIYAILKRRLDISYVAFCVSFMLAVSFIIILPYISTTFNLERLYQTALIVLALPTAIGLMLLFRPVPFTRIIVVAVCSLFFFYNVGLISQIGGGVPNVILNNFGQSYDKTYITENDYRTIKWLGQYKRPGNITHADQLWVRAYGNITNIDRSLVPSDITRGSYVFLSAANQQDHIAALSYQGKTLLYSPSTRFFNDNKNAVYSTGKTTIYR